MYASLGEILTLGLGRGEGIGPKFVPGAAGVILGERFTFSSALNCSAVGQSLTHPIRGPVPVLHLHDRGLTEWNPSSTWFTSLSTSATAALVVSVEDSSTLSTTELAYWSTALLQGSSVRLVNEGLSSSIAHLCRANHENQILIKQKMTCESTTVMQSKLALIPLYQEEMKNDRKDEQYREYLYIGEIYIVLLKEANELLEILFRWEVVTTVRPYSLKKTNDKGISLQE